MKNVLFITLAALCLSAIPVYAVTADMVLVPGGSFLYQNTTPTFVETFLIDKYETTNEDYRQFLNAADPCSNHWTSEMEIDRSVGGPPYSYTVQTGREKYPIGWVDYYDAEAFAQWRSSRDGVTCRLPTEEEWEKAAAWDPIEPNYYIYGFHQNDINCFWCNYNWCQGGSTEVGAYNGTGGKNDAKSYYGCYDMTGNVWEWTSGVIGSGHVIRGGGYNDVTSDIQVTHRDYYTSPFRAPNVGFRLVREPFLLVKTPDGGESWIAGTTQNIQWETSDPCISQVKIELSTNNGIDWNDVNTVPNTGSYQWVIPKVTSNQCLVRISNASDANVYDTSNDTFTIYECRLSSKADLNGDCKIDFVDLAIMAQDWLRNGNPFDENCTECPSIVWVYINDTGVYGHEGFTGYMSKYETTNAQYCQFLNAALASGKIKVHTDNVVYATSDTNHSQPYFTTEASSSVSQITYSDSAFSVRSRDGYSMANQPVVMVSWYGATAFCNYYGYRLPTEWEWQAVADYDGTYTYGCGTTINFSTANYYDDTNGFANPLGLTSKPYTSPVGYYPAYGYGMCDMAGNVWEWTSNLWDPQYDFRVMGGGCWTINANYCTVSFWLYDHPDYSNYDLGFRVCR